MPISLPRPRNILAKVVHDLGSLRADQRGNIAVMMAFLLPIIVGCLGLGFEASNWYLQTRAMQNAADAATIAAASNNSTNYDVEAKAVAAQYGFVDGTNNVTVTASNTATCPSGGNTCYSVTITGMVPLSLSQVVGYQGDITVNGVKEKIVSSAAIAQQTTIKQPICLLGLDQAGTAIQGNGSPKTTFDGCTIMSNSNATCNGSNLLATYGLAHGTNGGGAGCGNKQMSTIPTVPDPWAIYASAIPPQSTLADPSHCNNSYSNEKKKGSTWSGGVTWSGSKTLTSTASVGGNTLICGDLRLTSDVTINAPGLDGAVLFIDRGNLDLNGFTLSTTSGSAVTIVFTGASGGAAGAPIDNSNGGGFSSVCNTNGSCLNIQAPSSTTTPFPGIAIYQDPNMTTPTNFTYAGNSPTWDITGGVYMPYASIAMKGAINKSANGAVCMVMVANDVTIDGTGSIYAQTPDGSGCKTAGLNVPTATIPGRSKLVY
jgi:Flp pilus assembly protein TadG